MGPTFRILTILLLAMSWHSVHAQRFSIESPLLKTTTSVDIERVGNATAATSVYYLTDGAKLLDSGYLERLKSLHLAGKIPAAYYVFVGSVDETDGVDKRNRYFFCNPHYRSFFEKEVLPRVEKTIGKTFEPTQRGLIGISFGGLNAAWFAAKSEAFVQYALLSPVTYPCNELGAAISFSTNTALKIYISTGTNDAETYAEPLRRLFEGKRYRVHFEKTKGGHDFENWAGQLETLFRFFNVAHP